MHVLIKTQLNNEGGRLKFSRIISASLSSLVLHPVNSCQPASSDSPLHLLNLRGLPGFILPA